MIVLDCVQQNVIDYQEAYFGQHFLPACGMPQCLGRPSYAHAGRNRMVYGSQIHASHYAFLFLPSVPGISHNGPKQSSLFLVNRCHLETTLHLGTGHQVALPLSPYASSSAPTRWTLGLLLLFRLHPKIALAWCSAWDLPLHVPPNHTYVARADRTSDAGLARQLGILRQGLSEN